MKGFAFITWMDGNGKVFVWKSQLVNFVFDGFCADEEDFSLSVLIVSFFVCTKITGAVRRQFVLYLFFISLFFEHISFLSFLLLIYL